MDILIADDEKASRQTLQLYIEHWGHQSQAVQDGTEAWSVIKQKTCPHVILLDWEMPGMKGPEICQQMKELPHAAQLYVILLTGRDNDEDIVFGLNAGANDYIIKPFSEAVLKARLLVGIRMIETLQAMQKLNQNLLQANAKLTMSNQALALLSATDPLTNLANRRVLFEQLEKDLKMATREKTPLSLIIMDIDYFKKYNDYYGHQAGDQCLKAVANALKATTKRPADLIARYGGEEFLCVLPDTDAEGAKKMAHEFQQAIIDLKIPHKLSECADTVTLSLGVTTALSDTDFTESALIERADEALYAAKKAGRAQFCVADP